MAKAPQQQPAAQGVKYPKNWSTMNLQERRAWEQANRPGFNAAARAAAPLPAPQTGPLPPATPLFGDQGAASEYNAGLQTRAEETPPDEDQGDENEPQPVPADGIDARKILAQMLRALADGFECAE